MKDVYRLSPNPIQVNVQINTIIQFYSMIDGMQHGLLTRDALYLAVMDQNQIQNIASFDTDFDRVEYIMWWGI